MTLESCWKPSSSSLKLCVWEATVITSQIKIWKHWCSSDVRFCQPLEASCLICHFSNDLLREGPGFAFLVPAPVMGKGRAEHISLGLSNPFTPLCKALRNFIPSPPFSRPHYEIDYDKISKPRLFGHIPNIVGFYFFFRMQSSPGTSNMKSPWKLFGLFGAISSAAADLCNRKLVREISPAYWQWRALGFGRGDIWEAQFCCTTTQKQLEIYILRQVRTSFYGGGIHAV